MADPFLDMTITNAQGDRAFVCRDALALLRECDLALAAGGAEHRLRLLLRVRSFLSEVTRSTANG